MKSEYKKSMYEFYTQPDNFETMLHVADQAKWISKQLIIDFWTKTAQSLQETMKKRSGDWCVEFNGDWKARWIKLWVYKPSWRSKEAFPLLSVAVEDIQPDRIPYIGIHIGRDSTLINGNELKTTIEALEKLQSNYETDSNPYWARWKHIGIDNGKKESLIQLLPVNRSITIENIVSEYLILLDLVEEDITNLLSDTTIVK